MALIRILLLTGVAVVWFDCLVRISTGSGLMSYPVVAASLVSILVVSTLAVILASQWWVRLLFRPRKIEGDIDEAFARVAHILQHQAAQLNILEPELYIYDSNSLNAFIVGGIWHQQHLYLSEALVTELGHEEIEAVIAHELAHIHQQDVVVNEAFFGMGMIIQYLTQHSIGRLLSSLLKANNKAEMSKSIGFAITYGILLLPLWLLILAYSRRSEYRADAMASQIVGQQKFLWLLHRLNGVCRDSVFNLEEQEVLLRQYFTSHPSIHHRISALEARQQV